MGRGSLERNCIDSPRSQAKGWRNVWITMRGGEGERGEREFLQEGIAEAADNLVT